MNAVQFPGETSGSTPPVPAAPSAPAQADQRPAGMPEKFQSTADLIAAYKALESKLGSKAVAPETLPQADAEAKQPAAEEAPAQPSPPAKLDKIEEPAAPTLRDDKGRFVTPEALHVYESEFLEKGALGEASYKALEEAGLPKALVDNYIAGRQAQAREYVASVHSLAGGAEAYTAMTKWALNGLPTEERAAFNNAIEGGDMGQIKMAMRSLQAAYQAANGTAPTLVQGRAGPASGTAPFQSIQQIKAAMSDPRYATDEAYRQDVAKRLAGSKAL